MTTIIKYPGDGSTKVFPFSFDYDETLNTIEVYLKIDGAFVLQESGYTITSTPDTITFDTAPADGVEIKIQRDTDPDQLGVFTNNTLNNAEVMNRDNNVVKNVVEETKDRATSAASEAAQSAIDASGYADDAQGYASAASSSASAASSSASAASSSASSAAASAVATSADRDYINTITNNQGLQVIIEGGNSLDEPDDRVFDGGGA